MISTKGRYALRVMIDLAENSAESAVPLKAIAERQKISKKYLESIVSLLVRAKMIRGASGKGGGYVLCRAPEEYAVGEILEQTEGTLAVVACLAEGAAHCPLSEKCQTLPMWNEFNALVHDFFYTKTLASLCKKA